MPEITRFYGIVISIRFSREHNPPHFHATYGARESAFDIQSLEVLAGDLPSKAQSMVLEWASQHQADLLEMWDTKQLKHLEPLE